MFNTIATDARAYLDSLVEVAKSLDNGAIDEFGDLLFDIWQKDAKVFVIGNGGSASNASHHVTDYIKTARVKGQKALKAESLVDNIGLLTAIGNDIDYDSIFTYPLEAKASKGDLLVAISCSGNSGNVVSAVKWANENGLTTVALTGFRGGAIGEIANLHINVANENYGIIEDLQLSIGHIAAQILRARIEESLGEGQ